MSTAHFDVIIIGAGAGGGALARRLAPSGKHILILERGTFLPQEKENWDTKAVFVENRYHTDEVWQDSEGRPLHPQTAYWVGAIRRSTAPLSSDCESEISERSSTRAVFRPRGP